MFSLMFYPLLLFAIFWIGGNAANILLAFQKLNLDGSTEWIGFANFEKFFTDIFSGDDGILLRISFLNSLKSWALRFVISNPLYFLFSYYMFKNLAGHRVMRAIVMIPQILSTFLISLVFQKFVQGALPDLFLKFGISDFPRFFTDEKYTFGTMVFFQIWISFGTALILYPNAMKSIPEEIFESASLDGISPWKEFWYIIFPLIFPTVSTLIVTGIATVFTDGGPVLTFYMYDAYPEVYNLADYFYKNVMNVQNSTGYPYLAAGGLVLTAISVPLTFFLKWLMERHTPDVEY